MSNEELKALLQRTGLPVVYRFFDQEKSLPCICYFESDTDNFAADGVVYFSARRIQVELYTTLKDESLEDKVESALSSFFWQRSETYIESEQCYQVIYEIEV